MKITVKSKSPARKALIAAIARIYAKELNLEGHKFSLTIDTVKGFRKNTGWNGAADLTESETLGLVLDSQLSCDQLLITLAHEMVHVKQRVKGQLKQFFRRGKQVSTWLGKECKAGYYDSPWEIEAFRRERLLANKVAQIISQK